MVDSEYSTDNYKSWSSNKKSISIGAVIKNPEMVRFVPGHFKTKNMCWHIVKKLLFAIRYVPDWYKTQEMCGTLKFAPDSYKKLKMYNKVVGNYADALEYLKRRSFRM